MASSFCFAFHAKSLSGGSCRPLQAGIYAMSAFEKQLPRSGLLEQDKD
jgi:hypothetical protein